MKAGIARGCQRADIFGCLYFYLSDQLRQFIRRLRKFKISFKFFEKPPGVLAHQLSQGAYAHIGLAKDVVFDRIDFSDFADEDLGEGGSSVLVSVLNDWSPLLNKENPSATILGYFAEWVSKQRKSQPGTTEMRALTGQLIKQGKVSKYLPKSGVRGGPLDLIQDLVILTYLYSLAPGRDDASRSYSSMAQVLRGSI